MKVARILYPVEALGPGRRLCVWMQGCHRKCPGCANPELWDTNKTADLSLEFVLAMARSALRVLSLDGITITGGEPLLQAEELALLLEQLRPLCNDVLLFTGFTSEEINNCEAYKRVINNISVYVDGPYFQELNDGEKLRGSRNQQIVIRDENLKAKYQSYMEEPSHQIDNFDTINGIASVGIHPFGLIDLMREN